MSSNYFEKIKLQARQLDDGVEKLIKTWKLPQILIGGFGECTEETDVHIGAVWNTIRNTQNGIEKVLSELKNAKDDDNETFDMEQFLQESRAEYDHLRTQCDELNNVLAEYGYHYDDSDALDQTDTNNGKES
ncbi:uncharacterized protein LOC100880375 [Megachile rotundata]|uniref:uncharacterized protein LOC100880375 n=1 Tax=Megachile rotundata TaxID=143995 RepID=UPI000258E411|nr:PREDICTED: uncharacterized protein LOC100880375 [Megachile rotundata]